MTQASIWSPGIASGGLWAVQAKHYDAAYAIKKADLDSFLAESSRAEFSYRLLMATTDHLGPTARRTLEGQEKPVGTLLRSDLAVLDLALASLAGGVASREAETEAASSVPAQRRQGHRQGTRDDRSAARW